MYMSKSGVEQPGVLVGLITRRSVVQIHAPLAAYSQLNSENIVEWQWRNTDKKALTKFSQQLSVYKSK